MDRSEIQQFDVVRGLVAPGETGDLTPEGRRLIGQWVIASADWIIDDGFPYAGDWHMTLSRDDWRRTGVLWVPLCDLVDIQKLDRRSYLA